MAMETVNSYGSYTAQSTASDIKTYATKKKGTERTVKRNEDHKPESTADYMHKLAKLAPSVEFMSGNTHSSAKNGKTLTINPKLLEKMQNDPNKEKEMKELIQGVEFATKLLDGIHKARGWKVVYRHGYIDENGKYSSCAYVRNEFGYKMSEKLREERRENSEKFIEKIKEKAEKLIDEKTEAAKDGMIYLYDTDIKTIIEAAKEDRSEKTGAKEQPPAGANFDLKI